MSSLVSGIECARPGLISANIKSTACAVLTLSANQPQQLICCGGEILIPAALDQGDNCWRYDIGTNVWLMILQGSFGQKRYCLLYTSPSPRDS